MKKRIAFILLTLAVLLCLCPSFASSDEDKGARMVDHDPPIVTGITLDAASVTAPGTVIVTVTATDDTSGVAYVSAGFRNAEADSSLHANFSTYGDGVVIGTIEIGPYTYAGTHTIEFVNLGDNADTYIQYYGKGSEYYSEAENKLPNDLAEISFVAVQDSSPIPPAITTHPKDAKVKLGEEAKFKVKASGGTVTYQWYYRTSEDGKWKVMSGETGTILIVVAEEENIGWQFLCRATNEEGSTDSKIATLKLK